MHASLRFGAFLTMVGGLLLFFSALSRWGKGGAIHPLELMNRRLWMEAEKTLDEERARVFALIGGVEGRNPHPLPHVPPPAKGKDADRYAPTISPEGKNPSISQDPAQAVIPVEKKPLSDAGSKTSSRAERSEDSKEVSATSSSQPRRHVVAAGETLYAIAEEAYGNGALWRKLCRVNPHIDPDYLMPGDTLLLPPLEELVSSNPNPSKRP